MGTFQSPGGYGSWLVGGWSSVSWEVVFSRIGLSGFDGRSMMAAGLRGARR